MENVYVNCTIVVVRLRIRKTTALWLNIDRGIRGRAYTYIRVGLYIDLTRVFRGQPVRAVQLVEETSKQLIMPM